VTPVVYQDPCKGDEPELYESNAISCTVADDAMIITHLQAAALSMGWDYCVRLSTALGTPRSYIVWRTLRQTYEECATRDGGNLAKENSCCSQAKEKAIAIQFA